MFSNITLEAKGACSVEFVCFFWY